MYALGIDLGTTFTAAAVWRDGRAEISSLGSRTAAIPSVVLLREDETMITGEAANRRALTAPHRVAREFKRRLGDTTPIMLGGVPYSAEALTARLLRAVLDEVTTREGSAPSAICVSRPANWGPYKADLLQQAVRGADLDEVTFITEPEAAAIFYAEQQRIPNGAVVAVYDLGGGTFDAAVLRRSAGGFEILGRPEGIERLGGIDFDAAVFAHVARAIGSALTDLDDEDSAAITAVARLREECTQAKEALSADTDTTIPVLLPTVTTEVRLTRAELETMVRPALQDSIDALRRAVRSAGVTPEDLRAVLLVGGSSRMPIVAQLVGAELGRPVAVDAHPKHAVALGAASLAGRIMTGTPLPDVGGPAATSAGAPSVPVVGPAVAGAAAGAAAAALTSPSVPPVVPAGWQPAAAGSAEPVQPGGPPPVPWRPATPTPPPPTTVMGALPAGRTEYLAADLGGRAGSDRAGEPFGGDSLGSDPLGSDPLGSDRGGPRRGRAGAGPGLTRALSAAAVVAAIALGAGGIAALVRTQLISGNQPKNTLTATSGTAAATPGVPAYERCDAQLKANPRWVCLTSATFDGTKLTITYDADFHGQQPTVKGGYHLHIYGSTDGVNPPESSEGTQASAPGAWYVEDQNPSVRTASSSDFKHAIGDKPLVCARIANSKHRLVQDNQGGYHTGNCIPIERTGNSASTSAAAPGRTHRPVVTSTATPTTTPTSSTTPTPTDTATPTDTTGGMGSMSPSA